MSKAKEIMKRFADCRNRGEADELVFKTITKAIIGDDYDYLSHTVYDNFDNVERALREAFEELEARALPEGVEWPRYEDGEPVVFGDELPEFADTIYKTAKSIAFQDNGYVIIDNAGGSVNVNVFLKNGERIKRPQVFDADDVPIKIGDTIYLLTYDGKQEICCGFNCSGHVVLSNGCSISNKAVSHIEPDSWKRIEEDAFKDVEGYFSCRNRSCGDCTIPDDMGISSEHYGKLAACAYAMRKDLVRRCKALSNKG